MKKIAFTCRLEENQFETRECLDVEWTKLCNTLGYLPVILPVHCDIELMFKNISIDGIILTGGNDLNTINNSPLSQTRDAFETNVIQYAITHSVPLLGVCRGMQILATHFDSEIHSVTEHVATTHPLTINQNSRYSSILKTIKSCNSYHNYAVSNVPSEFTIAAQSNDNTIEAIEHSHLPIFGHMWHPERKSPFWKEQLELIHTFFTENK